MALSWLLLLLLLLLLPALSPGLGNGEWGRSLANTTELNRPSLSRSPLLSSPVFLLWSLPPSFSVSVCFHRHLQEKCSLRV